MATSSLTEFLKEARRRRVFRVAGLYIVAAWVTLQAADLAFPGLDIPESAIRYVWMGAVLVLPIALFLGWRYDIIGGRIVRTAVSDIDADLSIERADYVILTALSVIVAAIAFGLVGEISKTRVMETAQLAVTDIDPRSVAVLPFVNISGNPDNEYFSDGLTETLLHALAQLPDLKVPARTSSFFFKGQDVDVREIARQLGVSNVLEGSVQRDGNKIRIVAQLIDADTGFHLWSNTYDRDMSDIFEVQDDIASRVALAMEVTFSGDTGQGGGKIETVGTDNVVAYEKYLQGLQQENIGSNTPMLLAEVSFKGALALDPDFYEARLELAHTYSQQHLLGLVTFSEAMEHLEPLLDQLLEHRPDDGLVLTLVSYVEATRFIIQGEGSFDVEQHMADLTAAIERKPNEPRLYAAMVRLLRFVDRPEQAIKWVERGIAVDPLDWDLHSQRAGLLIQAGDLDGAQVSYARAIELNPGNPSVLTRAANVHWIRKQYAEAFALERQAMEADPLDYEMPAMIALMLYTFGLTDEGDKYLQRATTIASDEPWVQLARLYRLLLDDHSRARDMSEALLRDDIEDRFGTYWFATMVFMSTMTESGKTEDALAVLEELRPGVSSPDFVHRGSKELALQYFAVLAMAESQSQEVTLSMLDAVVPRWDESSPFWRDSAGRVAQIALARGQMETAIELTLDNLEIWFLQEMYPYPVYRHIYYYKTLAQEPAVAKRLAELDAEAKKAGEDVWAYIVEHDL